MGKFEKSLGPMFLQSHRADGMIDTSGVPDLVICGAAKL